MGEHNTTGAGHIVGPCAHSSLDPSSEPCALHSSVLSLGLWACKQFRLLPRGESVSSHNSGALLSGAVVRVSEMSLAGVWPRKRLSAIAPAPAFSEDSQ